MFRRATSTWAVLVVLVVFVSGCKSVNWSWKDKEPTDGTTAKATEKAAAEGAEASATAPKVTRDDGKSVVYSLAYPTGRQETSALLLHKVVPTEVRVGQPFEYEIKVDNLTDLNLEQVVVKDLLPETFKIDDAAPAFASSEEGFARWVLGTLGPLESKTIRVKGVANARGTLLGCTDVTYVSNICSSIEVVEPRLTLSRKSPAEVTLCDSIPVEYIVTNAGSGTAKNVRIEESLPKNLVTDESASKITLAVGDLAAGESRTVSTKLQASVRGDYQCRAKAIADGNITAESEAAKTTARQPILKISMQAPVDGFVARPVKHAVTITNVGDAVAENTVLLQTFPDGVEVIDLRGGIRSGNAVRWDIGALEPRESRDISLGLRSASAGVLRTTASLTAECAKKATAAAQTTLTGIPAVLLEVVDQSDPVMVGGNETYTITVTNQGTAAATRVRITCTLEDNMKYISSSGITLGSGADNTITFEPLSRLEPKAKASWKVVVNAASAADVRFKVSMTSAQMRRPVEETEATTFYN